LLFSTLPGLAAVGLAGCSTISRLAVGPAVASDVLVVGVNLELSGPAALWGQGQLDALTLLADKLNAQGRVRIKLVPYDNESSETKALVVARRLIEEDRVSAVIGGGTTPTTMPVVPVANELETVVMSVASSNAIIEPVEERRWVFKTPNRTQDFVERVLRHLLRTGATHIGFLSVNNAYGDAGRGEMEKAAPGAGISITTWEEFGASDTDMKPQLSRIRATNPDAIVVWAIPPAASIVARNRAELGISAPLIHDGGAAAHAYLELAGDAAEGATIVAFKAMVAAQLPDTDPVKPVATEYVREYEAKYGRKAGGVDAPAHDALLLIARAAEQSGTDRSRLRDVLENLRNVVGASGVYNLSARDHNGPTAKDMVVTEIRDGLWRLVS
jgi:branched-chain amino acid transport system substrate-binding protein